MADKVLNVNKNSEDRNIRQARSRQVDSPTKQEQRKVQAANSNWESVRQRFPKQLEAFELEMQSE